MGEFSFPGTASGLYGTYDLLNQGATITDIKGKVVVSENNKESTLDLSDPKLLEHLQNTKGHIEVIPHEIKLTV
jgi:hypothetical protein